MRNNLDLITQVAEQKAHGKKIDTLEKAYNHMLARLEASDDPLEVISETAALLEKSTEETATHWPYEVAFSALVEKVQNSGRKTRVQIISMITPKRWKLMEWLEENHIYQFIGENGDPAYFDIPQDMVSRLQMLCSDLDVDFHWRRDGGPCDIEDRTHVLG